MKAKITKVTLKGDEKNKWEQYTFFVEYDGKKAFYNDKSKDQDYFVVGQEAEFTEEERTSGTGKTYLVVKRPKSGGNSNWGKQLKREQSKYSGFAVSYVKDLIISGHVKISDWESASKKIFNFMVDLDKSIEK